MNAPALIGTSQLAIYERMCSAIAECVAVDEAKDIRDKALALEAYYRQARNLDAEREAANIRLRAERRVGELLKELARADHADAGRASGAARAANASPEDTRSISERAMPRGPSPYAAALQEHGISRQTAHKFQTLAAIPEADFERALFEARPEVAQARDLREEASEATEAVADLQHHVRLATKDGRLTRTERDRLANVHAEAERQLRDVGDLIKREA